MLSAVVLEPAHLGVVDEGLHPGPSPWYVKLFKILNTYGKGLRLAQISSWLVVKYLYSSGYT